MCQKSREAINERNDLNRETGIRPPDLIAKSIIGLAITMKSNSQNVGILSIIMRNNNLNDKAAEVNGRLKRFCKENNFFFDRPYKIFPFQKYQ